MKYWKADSPAIRELTHYIDQITDPKSPLFIPEEGRIVVSDMDGTMISESLPYMAICLYWAWLVLDDPEYQDKMDDLREEEKLVAQNLRECMEGHCIWKIAYTEEEIEKWMIHSFDKYSPSYRQEKARHWLQNTQASRPYDKLKMADTFYLPMIELLHYLIEHHFRLFIVSGSETEFCEAMLCNSTLLAQFGISISEAQIIGSVDGEAKVKALEKQNILPLIALGNSSGDYPMLDMVASKGFALCLLNDDTVRDYGSLSRAERIGKRCTETNIHTISMAKEWLKLYQNS